MNLENKIPPPIIALITGIVISASSAIIKPFNIYGIEFVAIMIIAGSFLIIILPVGLLGLDKINNDIFLFNLSKISFFFKFISLEKLIIFFFF